MVSFKVHAGVCCQGTELRRGITYRTDMGIVWRPQLMTGFEPEHNLLMLANDKAQGLKGCRPYDQSRGLKRL